MIAWVTTNKWWLVGIAVACCGGYGIGRYALPTSEEWRSVVSIQTHEVEVVKEVEKRVEVKGPIRVVTRTVERVVPGQCGQPPTILHDTEVVEEEGPVTITTDTTTDEHKELETLGVTATEHVVKHDAPRLTLLFTFGSSVTSPSPVYGGEVVYRLLGPITLAAGFDSSLRATIAAGLTF